MLEWIERRFKSAYLRMMEAEVERLRDENRQLVNSMLAAHGQQQIDAPRSKQAFQPLKRSNWHDTRRRMETESRIRMDGLKPEDRKKVAEIREKPNA